MKTVALIISMFVSLIGIAQAKLGMSNVYAIAPASVTNSSVGATYNSTISIKCAIQNKGNAVFNGAVTLRRTVISGTVQSSSPIVSTLTITLNPNDTIGVTFIDSVTPANYKQNGNGNTVVVWPVSSGISTLDSLHTAPIYVNSNTQPNAITELFKHKLIIYPNPTTGMLFIKPEENRDYHTVTIYDTQLKEVMKIPFTERIEVKNLASGIYTLKLSGSRQTDISILFTKTD